MIHIDRLPEPQVLASSKVSWTQAYLDKRATVPTARPSSNQYAHREIVERLESMSHHKCFYCERSTKETKQEVDHYIECAERPELAFEWSNLYLTCQDCNRKKEANSCMSVESCIDPCDPHVDPATHLKFDEQFIRMRDEKGRMTIQKYKLDRGDLDYLRLRRLRVFDKELIRLQKLMIVENRPMRNDERELLESFTQPDAPFSLMFRSYLPQQGI